MQGSIGRKARGAGPRRRFRRILAWLGGGLALALLLILIGLAAFDPGSLRPQLEATASRALGQPVRVDGSIDIDLFGGPALRVGDVSVGEDQRPVVNAGQVRLTPKLTSLLTGSPRLAEVHADGARIRLARDAEGRWNLAAANGDAPAAREGTGALPAVRLSDAALAIVDRAGGPPLTAEGCQLALPTLGLAGEPGDSTLARLRLEGTLDCERLQRGALTVHALRVGLGADGGRLTAAPLSARVFDGRLEGEAHMEFVGDAPALSLDYRLEAFALQAFLRRLSEAASASGQLNLAVNLESRGADRETLLANLSGTARLAGSGLEVEGVDLDERLAEYRSTQRFNLVDVGAFLFAGPAGLAVTKGYDYTRLLREGEGVTPITELVSEWEVRDGIARARDVALATEANRLIALGTLDLRAQRFRDFRVLLVDPRGCAVMEQAITGTFADPGVPETTMVASLLGPLTSLVERGIEALTPDDCEPVYDGSVEAPGSQG